MKFLIAAAVLVTSQVAFSKVCKTTVDLTKYKQGIMVTCQEAQNMPPKFLEDLCTKMQMPNTKAELLASCPSGYLAKCVQTGEQSNKALEAVSNIPGAQVEGKFPANAVFTNYYYSKEHLSMHKPSCKFGKWTDK